MRFALNLQIVSIVLRPAASRSALACSPPGSSPGTLGCLVSRGSELFILSNNHVIAGHNALPLNAHDRSTWAGQDLGVCPGHITARLAQFVPIHLWVDQRIQHD